MAQCCRCNRTGSCRHCACVKAGKQCTNCLPNKLGTCSNVCQTPSPSAALPATTQSPDTTETSVETDVLVETEATVETRASSNPLCPSPPLSTSNEHSSQTHATHALSPHNQIPSNARPMNHNSRLIYA